MVAGRPSPAPLGPVYPAGSALGGGWGLLWPYGSRVFRWCLDAVKKLPCLPGKTESGAHLPSLADTAGRRRWIPLIAVAESKLMGVALRIWPLNPTANGRNFNAD